MKIVFVILHYLAIDETYKSVDSIEKKSIQTCIR